MKRDNGFNKIITDCAQMLGIDKKELIKRLYKQFKIDKPK